MHWPPMHWHSHALTAVVLSALLAVALSAPAGAVAAQRESLDRVVAVVNDDVVLASDLAERLKTVEASLREQGTPIPARKDLRRQVLEQLVLEQLQLQLAERTGIRVSDEDLNEALRNIAERNGLSLRRFREVLARDGYDFAAFRERIRRQMTLSRLRQREVQNRVQISDKEIQRFLEREQPLAENLEYRLGHILVSLPGGASPQQVQEAKAKAQRLMERLDQGEPFGQLAAAESDGQQALEGGDLGWRPRAQVPTVFAEAIAGLEPSEYAGPIRSPSGFHIVKLLDRRGETRHVVTQTHARHILVKTDTVMSEDEAQRRLAQLKQRIEAGEGFASLARSHSDDPRSASEGGDLGWLNPGELPPPLAEAAADLEAGELSEPIKTPAGWHLLQVVERRRHDSTEQYRRAKARQQLLQRKAEERLDLWLRQLRDEAYVDIRLGGQRSG